MYVHIFIVNTCMYVLCAYVSCLNIYIYIYIYIYIHVLRVNPIVKECTFRNACCWLNVCLFKFKFSLNDPVTDE
jgi:hypothetical protein